ncbi:MAG TPA: cupredoxin family protein [Burkholderiaceae bacterium]|nr:cupredoxin family protein [Burkholderiaceae bacterium]
MIRTLIGAMLVVGAAAVHAHGAAHGRHAAPARAPNLEPVDKPFGRTGDPRRVTRTIEIRADDRMRYAPDAITVRQGETVRLKVRNHGKVMHELVLGTMAELKEHAEWMKKHPGMEHDEPYMAHLGPGESGEIVWQFTQPGEFYFACLIPGHFEAGMIGKIVVTPAADAAAGNRAPQ